MKEVDQHKSFAAMLKAVEEYQVKAHCCVVWPSDFLYIPAGWWHYVEVDAADGAPNIAANLFVAHGTTRATRPGGMAEQTFIEHPCPAAASAM